MGQITQDGDISKKGSLFLELWAIIVATLKGVESKPRCFLASFCWVESEYVANYHIGPLWGATWGAGGQA